MIQLQVFLTVWKKIPKNQESEDMMKRKDILKKLTKAGFTFQEGANHTKAYNGEGVFKATIGRHTDIPEIITRKIEKQTGVKLR